MSRHSAQPCGQPGVRPALLPSVSGSLSVRLSGSFTVGMSDLPERSQRYRIPTPAPPRVTLLYRSFEGSYQNRATSMGPVLRARLQVFLRPGCSDCVHCLDTPGQPGGLPSFAVAALRRLYA